jgi:hypothetical protein
VVSIAVPTLTIKYCVGLWFGVLTREIAVAKEGKTVWLVNDQVW